MQTLESFLEKEQIEDTAGWKLLAMFYLATDRLNDLARIETQYKNITGISLSADLRKQYMQWFNDETASDPVAVFEIPRKITAVALPDSNSILRGQYPPGAYYWISHKYRKLIMTD